MEIAVFGLGHVGLSNYVLLAQHDEAVAYHITRDRLDVRSYPGRDPDLKRLLATQDLNLAATPDPLTPIAGAGYVIVATSINNDMKTIQNDKLSAKAVIKAETEIKPGLSVIIRLKIPVGLVENVSERRGKPSVISSHQFVLEGQIRYKSLHLTPIIVGERSKRARVSTDCCVTGRKRSRARSSSPIPTKPKTLNYTPTSTLLGAPLSLTNSVAASSLKAWNRAR